MRRWTRSDAACVEAASQPVPPILAFELHHRDTRTQSASQDPTPPRTSCVDRARGSPAIAGGSGGYDRRRRREGPPPGGLCGSARRRSRLSPGGVVSLHRRRSYSGPEALPSFEERSRFVHSWGVASPWRWPSSPSLPFLIGPASTLTQPRKGCTPFSPRPPS